MKQTKIAALAAALLGLWGCGQNIEVSEAKGTGTIQPTLEPGAAIVISSGPSKAGSTVDVSGFGVKIVDPQAGKELHNYSSYSEVPKELTLEAGEYVMTAANNGVQKGAAFDRPYYAGSRTFSVKVGEVTPVKVLCELQSTGVEVAYTPKMLSELSNISVTVSVSGGILPYTPDEKRTGWFTLPDNKEMTIAVSGTRGGKSITNSQLISGIAAKELRRVTLDIKTSGSSETVIDIDEKIIRKDVTVSVPDADDVIDNNGDTGSWEEGGEPTKPTGGPTIIGKSWEGNAFDIDKTLTIDPNTIRVLDVMMSSAAAGGITNLWLEIDSELLKEPLAGLFGITGPIDLANPEPGASWVDAFVDLGIIDKNSPIKGKTEHLFSVGGLLGMLGPVDPQGGTPHRFKLKVIDANGTTDKVLTIVLFYP